MNRHEKRPLNLFFIEITIALLFFSISGAVILSVFAGADKKSHEGEMLESVIMFSQSVAEVYSMNGDADEAVRIVTEQCGKLDESIVLSKSEETEESPAGTFSRLLLEFKNDEKVIYSFACAAYIQNGGSR